MRISPFIVLSFGALFSASFTLSQFPARIAEAAPSFAEKMTLPGFRNMGKISDTLFRGAQPHLSHLSELKTLGISTIVDLRRESRQTTEAERVQAKALGIQFVHIPVGGFSTPTSSQLAEFFNLLREAPPRKIFVHCEFGEDRTGVFIAAYRIGFENWTAEQALAEMNTFGFNGPWHPGMASFIRALPERLRTDPTLKAALAKP